MTKKTIAVLTILLMTITAITLTASAAPGGNAGQRTPQVALQAEFQQALAERLGTSVEVIQEAMDEATLQAQQSLVRPMNIAPLMITILAEKLDMALADVEAAFNEVHLTVTGTLPGAQSQVFNTPGRGNSGRNSANSSMSARGRNSANVNTTCSSRSSGRSGRSSGNRGNNQNSTSNNAANNNSARQAIYQSAVLHYAAINLSVDYDTFHAAYLEAYDAALAYVNTATVRPINMQTKLFEYLAVALDKTILEVEEAFNDAKAKVFGS
jgi:hypothetical protein